MMHLGSRCLLALSLVVAGCSTDHPEANPGDSPVTGPAIAVIDTVRTAYFEASGTAEPFATATLSTRLMATVLAVAPVEGTSVRRGDILVRLDARDLTARQQQVAARIQEATALHDLAIVTANRMRAMYADSAAPRAQLDAAEAGLSRAASGLAAARAGAAELEATAAYATVRAPFDGVVTRRFVDPGAFAAPGAPLLTIEASDRLRITGTIPATLARHLTTGHQIDVRLADSVVHATIEGVVPRGGNLYTVNALLANPDRAFLAGSPATLMVATGTRPVLLVPAAALVRQGDLVGVRRRVADGAELTWLRIGNTTGDLAEVLSGLMVGDSVLMPTATNGSR